MQQRLVNGCEDGVSHPRVHPPHERSAVGEHQPQCSVNDAPGRRSGLAGIAVFVSEGAVVHPPRQRRNRPAAAITGQPADKILVLNRREPVFDNAVAEDSVHDPIGRIETDEQMADCIIGFHVVL